MTTGTCGFPREWLVALRDGELQAAQLEIAELHLRACPDCRRWMTEMDEVDRLLRQASPYRDNPLARAEIKARVATAPLRARPFGTTTVARRGRRALTVGLSALAVFVLIAGLWREPLTEASSGLGDWLRDEPVRQLSARDIANATPITAPTIALGPRELPLGLAQAGTLETGDDFARRYFRAISGLAISYTIDCGAASFVTLPSNDELSEIAGVNGASVLVLYGLDRERVVALYWATGDTLHEVLILEEEARPLSLDSALQISAALMEREAGPAAVACGG